MDVEIRDEDCVGKDQAKEKKEKFGQFGKGDFEASPEATGASDGFDVDGYVTMTFSAFQRYQYIILNPLEAPCGLISSRPSNLSRHDVKDFEASPEATRALDDFAVGGSMTMTL